MLAKSQLESEVGGEGSVVDEVGLLKEAVCSILFICMMCLRGAVLPRDEPVRGAVT